MPGGDRTGPLGQGPMTGRGAGQCGKAGAAGFGNRLIGRVFGRGRAQGVGRKQGGGRGRRNMFFATGLTGWQRASAEVDTPATGQTPPSGLSAQEELELLRQEADLAAAAVDEIRQRIEEIESAQSP